MNGALRTLTSLPDRLEKQVLEVIAEVGVGRDRRHFGLVDRPARVQGERDERVGPELPVPPADDERVVLPVLAVPDQRRRMGEADDEPAALLPDRDVAVPSVAVEAGVAADRKRRLRGSVSRRRRLADGFGRLGLVAGAPRS